MGTTPSTAEVGLEVIVPLEGLEEEEGEVEDGASDALLDGACEDSTADEDEAAELAAIDELEEESAAALDDVWDEDVSSGSERLHCVIKTMATVITRRANVSTIAK